MGFEPSHSWCFVGIKERKVSLDVFQIKFQGDFKKKHSSGRDPIEFCWPQIIMGWKKKSPFQWVHTYMVGWWCFSYDLPEVSEWMRKDWDTGP